MKKIPFLVFLWVSLMVSPALHAQYTAADYLNWTITHLDRGNCDDAKETYALYKEKVPQGNTEVERRIAECGKSSAKSFEIKQPAPTKYIPQGYVDLDLPSGTLWKASNEAGYYNYKDAVNTFGNKLPTSSQFDELVENCSWVWYGAGFKVIGKNGNYIMLPAAGSKTKNKGDATEVGTSGTYWTSETWRTSNEDAVVFGISNDYGGMHFCYRHYKLHGLSVRLVNNN